jgi:alkanesulfonate monooxygenase SsuD/methylene tetrahydromethanopterin reductase-like flavin-dependent oxidoreductase (luciferase family)
MNDYGHALEFGVFITPAAQAAENVVALATLADRTGLDLVTFQDHPYQARFLDTWTLLSFVAARTSRVRVSANVLNLPLRNPAVVARAVASLDILSGGRAELGLGAGAFWDGIEAMGGQRLSPGQSVDALEEAIEVIRALWDVEQPGKARVDGSHYRLKGAARGPAPLHGIGIWVGAYKPRMLNLTGRKADGWLPSLPYLEPGDLARGNAAIDEAAVAAGRDPSEIRRLLNVTAETGVEELIQYALEDGVGTFLMMADDDNTLQSFASETVPAVREQVTAERSRGVEVPPAERVEVPVQPSGAEDSEDDRRRATPPSSR